MDKYKKIFGVILVGTVFLTACSSKAPDTADASAQNNTPAAEPSLASETEPPSPLEIMSVIELNFAGVTSVATKEASELWKEIVEKETDGSIIVNLYPDNMLADDIVAIENTQSGSIELSTISTSPMSGLVPDFYMFDAPYLFINRQEALDAMDGTVGQDIMASMESVGLKGLMFWENGFRHLANNKKPVGKVGDLKGLRIRTMENEVHMAAWSALGVEPLPMAFQAIFTAISQDMIDGLENSLGVFDSNLLYEITPYITLTQHVYAPYITVMNLELWESLSPEQQQAIEKANAQATVYQRNRSAELENEILEKFNKENVAVSILDDNAMVAFQEIIEQQGIYEMIKEKMDHPEYINNFLN